MKAKGDRVIVRKLDVEDEARTPSGLVLTSAVLEELGRQPIGVVTDVGPEIQGVTIGEMVLYQRHGGTEVTIDEVEYLVFRESEILAGLDEIEVRQFVERGEFVADAPV